MKVTFLGRYLLADFGIRVGKKVLDLKKEEKRTREEREKTSRWGPYKSRAQVSELVHSVFEHPAFQRQWERSRERACEWLITMDDAEFLETFGIEKLKR